MQLGEEKCLELQKLVQNILDDLKNKRQNNSTYQFNEDDYL